MAKPAFRIFFHMTNRVGNILVQITFFWLRSPGKSAMWQLEERRHKRLFGSTSFGLPRLAGAADACIRVRRNFQV